jgi:hypothetical protein
VAPDVLIQLANDALFFARFDQATIELAITALRPEIEPPLCLPRGTAH